MKESLKKIVDNIAALIKVKTIVTIVVIVLFAAMALAGSIDPEVVSNIVSIVIGFYFGTQLEKKG